MKAKKVIYTILLVLFSLVLIADAAVVLFIPAQAETAEVSDSGERFPSNFNPEQGMPSFDGKNPPAQQDGETFSFDSGEASSFGDGEASSQGGEQPDMPNGGFSFGDGEASSQGGEQSDMPNGGENGTAPSRPGRESSATPGGAADSAKTSQTENKAILTLLCAVALVVGSVFATLAYFTDTESVTNTFTVGKVDISMDELNTDGKDADGEVNTAERDTANKYHLIPGKTYTKDPTIHVVADSEDCWLFVEVKNGLANIEAAVDNKGTVSKQISDNGWTLLAGKTDVYYKKWVSTDNVDQQVFSEFKIDGDKVVNMQDGKPVPADKIDLKDYANANITVTAYAVQAEGFDTAADAWSATFGKPQG